MLRLLLTVWLVLTGVGYAHAKDEPTPSHWGYEAGEGADHWGMLSPAYMTCEAGSHQSPINVMMALHPQRQNRLVFDYEPAKVRVVDNGHTIQVNVPSGSVLRLNDRDYMLGQFHFHEPSEHHLDGQAYPMEMHLVHRDQKGHLVVVAILIETGAPHQALAALWSMLPTKVGEQISEQTFNPQDLLPASTHHFTYHGSLTTPPCTEGVQWIILRDPITLAKEQIAKFVSVIGHNARPVQPLRGRKVLEE